MADKEKQLTFNIIAKTSAATHNLIAVGGSLQTLGKRAVAANNNLKSLDGFYKLKKVTVDAKQAWQAAAAEVTKLGKAIAATEAPSRKQLSEFGAAKRQLAKLKTEYEQSNVALNKHRQAMEKAGQSTTNIVAQQKKLKASLAAARKEAVAASKINMARGILDVKPHKAVQREIAKLRAAYKRLKDSGKLSARELYNAQLQLERKTNDLRHSTNGWADSISKAKSGLMALAGVGYAAVKSVQGFAEFSQRMAEVGTLTDASAERMKNLGDEITNLSTQIPQTAADLASAEYDIISAGVDLENSSAVLEQAAKAAVAGVTDTKTAVNAGLGVVNAYGLEIDELGNVYDVLFQTVKQGVTTFPELAQHLGETLPTAKAAGVTYQQLGASLAILTKAGIRTPQAATAIKGAINAMAAPAPEAKKRFEDLGITWEGLIPTLQQLADKNLSLDQMRLLIPDTEARTGVLALTQKINELKVSVGEMDTAAGSAAAAYDKMKDTPTNQLVLFKNAITALAREMGGFLSTVLLPVTKGLTALVRGLNSLPGPIRAFIAMLASAAGAFALWKLGLRDISLGLKGMLLDMGGAVGKLGTKLEALGLVADGTLKGLATSGLTSLQGFAAGLSATTLAAGGLVTLIGGGVYLAWSRWNKQQQEVADRARKTHDETAKVIKVFERYKDLNIPTDNSLFDMDIEKLKELQGEMASAREYWSATLKDLEAQMEVLLHGKDEDFVKSTQRYKDLSAAISAAKEKLAGFNQAIASVGEAQKVAAERAKEHAFAQKQANIVIADAVKPAEVLQQALDDQIDTVAEMEAAVKKSAQALVDAEMEAAAASAQGGEVLEKALQKRTAARAKYVSDVNRLNAKIESDFETQLDNEETDLENSLDARLIELRGFYDQDIIDKREYDRRKAEAEQDVAEQILEIRQKLYAKAKKMYGEDSQAAIDARQEVAEAENAVAAAVNATRKAYDNLHTTTDTVAASAKKAAEATKAAGEAAEKAGKNGAESMDEYAASISRVSTLLQGAHERAKGFYGLWGNIDKTIKKLNGDDLKDWAQQNYQQLWGAQKGTGNQFTGALNQHARDVYLKKLVALELDSKKAASRGASSSSAKQMTINLKAADGHTVSGSFAENDAGALLEILRKAGMVTA